MKNYLFYILGVFGLFVLSASNAFAVWDVTDVVTAVEGAETMIITVGSAVLIVLASIFVYKKLHSTVNKS